MSSCETYDASEVHNFKLVAVTGYRTKADRQAFEAAGFDHYFPKPPALLRPWTRFFRDDRCVFSLSDVEPNSFTLDAKDLPPLLADPGLPGRH